jgi:hypothetical protein
MLNTSNRLLTFFILSITLFSVSCSAKDDSISINASCEAMRESIGDLPDLVIIGTDVVDVSTIKPSSEQLEGNYLTDIGGAILSLSIKLSSNKHVVHRKYQEPGESVMDSAYHPVCVLNGAIYAKNVVIKAVQGGVLVLESKSEVDGIPTDLWVFYNRISK